MIDKRRLASAVMPLARVDPWRGLVSLAVDWGVIVGMAALAWRFLSPWLWPMAWLVIGARQHGLGILMHEASHYMLLGKNRANDILSDVLCAFPLFVSTSTYRRNHLKHHAYLDTDLDPDWMVRIQEPTVRRDWEFPKSRRQLCWLFLRELFGGGALYMLTKIRRFGGRGMAGRNAVRRGPAAHILRGMYYVVVAGVFTTLGLWVHFFLWWVIPAFTFLPALLRVRGIAEHFGLPGQHELNNARNIHAPFWERWLLAPHYICRHLDHHLFPYVPFYRLPELHRILEREPLYRQLAHENHAYFFGGRPAVVDDLLGTVTAERAR